MKLFRDFIEKLKSTESQSRLVIVLNTPGGTAEAVEKMVEIVRFHYSEVWFVVPDYAMSAGTIFCMSGDKIFMDYSSSLGPIDPQVPKGNEYVPALGYLEKVEQLLEKARHHGTNPARVGQLVTDQEKQQRAEEIAKALGDHKFWHSHGRMISAETATKVLKLKIDDYSHDTNLRNLVRSYNDLLIEYIGRNDYKLFMHSRNYF
ncbi:MAG: SDH family Clp fold serine proteinase [Pyrinomonadaceae bacterium]